MKRYSCLSLFLLLVACNANTRNEKQNSSPETNTAQEKNEAASNSKLTSLEEGTTNSDADILNNISLHQSGGLKVAQAFLTFEDGKLVPKSNETALHEPVYLNLIIDSGWKVKGEQSSIDATEIITTHEGEIVLNAPNLFKDATIMDAKDATRILLKANITRTRPDIDFFVVNYRVWDKWSDAEVKGSYQLFVKNGSVKQ